MDVVARLEHLLLVEIERRKRAEREHVARSDEAVELAAQQRAPAADRLGAEILDVEVDRGGNVDDADLADHLARHAGARRAQRQADVIARQILGEEEVALGLLLVEHRLADEFLEIGGDQLLRAARLATNLDRNELRHQHLEVDDAVLDALRRHLDGGEIALAAQDRRGGVADLAHRGDRDFLADQIGEGRPQDVGVHDRKIVEHHVAERHLDRGEARIGERAGRALDPALDRQARWRRRSGRGDRRLDLLAGRCADAAAAGWRWRRKLRKDRATARRTAMPAREPKP